MFVSLILEIHVQAFQVFDREGLGLVDAEELREVFKIIVLQFVLIACFIKEFSIFFTISPFQFYLSRFIKGISVFYSVCSSKPYCSIVQCIAIGYFMILDKFLLLLPLHYVQVLTSVGEKLSQEEVPSELLNLCKSPQLHFFVKQKSSNVSKCFTHVGG